MFLPVFKLKIAEVGGKSEEVGENIRLSPRFETIKFVNAFFNFQKPLCYVVYAVKWLLVLTFQLLQNFSDDVLL